MKKLPKSLPEVIYLQWFGDGEFDPDAEVSESDVTWCREKMFYTDYTYVLVKQPPDTKETRCHRCLGKGADPEDESEYVPYPKCRDCAGSGRVKVAQP